MWRRTFRTTTSFALLALASAGAGAQMWGAVDFEAPPVTLPEIVETAASAQGFVPRGWMLVDRKSGDLNADKADDLALLLRMADPANIVPIPSGEPGETWDTNPFLLVVAFADPAGGYRLAAKTPRVFDRPDVPYNGSPPPDESAVRIERGTLVVFNEYLRNWESYRFRWSDGEFRLVGHDEGGASGACIGTRSIDYLTGQVRWSMEPMGKAGRTDRNLRTRAVELPTLATFDKNGFIAADTVVGDPPPCLAY